MWWVKVNCHYLRKRNIPCGFPPRVWYQDLRILLILGGRLLEIEVAVFLSGAVIV
jgi:hypothetical protein